MINSNIKHNRWILVLLLKCAFVLFAGFVFVFVSFSNIVRPVFESLTLNIFVSKCKICIRKQINQYCSDQNRLRVIEWHSFFLSDPGVRAHRTKRSKQRRFSIAMHNFSKCTHIYHFDVIYWTIEENIRSHISPMNFIPLYRVRMKIRLSILTTNLWRKKEQNLWFIWGEEKKNNQKCERKIINFKKKTILLVFNSKHINFFSYKEQSIVADMPHSNQSESIAHQFAFYGCEFSFLNNWFIRKIVVHVQHSHFFLRFFHRWFRRYISLSFSPSPSRE